MKRIITVLLLSVFAFGNCYAAEEQKEITKEEYRDKTLACILGHIGGFLSGFEFVTTSTGEPYVGLPDEWFNLCNGPYGGGEKHGSAGNSCVLSYGEILQDDDYHVDFFNQLIFDACDGTPSSFDIQTYWKKHQVQDWGGGYSALQIINKLDFIPPFTGMLECGNIYSWCTEPYIENETVGCIAPGMAQLADYYTHKFAQTTGEYESVLWARLFGVTYSLAYFETEAATALHKAAQILPEWSWTKFIYEKAVELYEKYPDDWRTAASVLQQYGRHIYLMDNEHVAYDINGGFTVLSILYGENDYYETIKTASLMGYDGDCTAATVGGLMGIIHGMEGTHDTVKEVVYAYGEGVLVNNDTYVPYIKTDYPERQTFDSLADLYTSNAEKVLQHAGAEITETSFIITTQEAKAGCEVVITNRDFEDDTLPIYTAFENGAQGGIDKVSSATPHSGSNSARILTSKEGATGKVYVEATGLEVGKTYKLSGYLLANGANRASLFVENGDNYFSTSTYYNTDWYCRSIVFQATETTANIGLYVPPTSEVLYNAYLDDILIDECVYECVKQVEAETLVSLSTSATAIDTELENASGAAYLAVEKAGKIEGITLSVEVEGEYLMRIAFSNPVEAGITARVFNGDEAQAKFPFFQTGDTLSFEQNIVEVPIELVAGENTLSLRQFSNSIAIDYIEVVKDKSAYISDTTTGNIEVNSDKKTTPIVCKIGGDSILSISHPQEGYESGSIYTPQGRLVMQFPTTATRTKVDIESLPKGVYILQLMGNSLFSTRFVYS